MEVATPMQIVRLVRVFAWLLLLAGVGAVAFGILMISDGPPDRGHLLRFMIVAGALVIVLAVIIDRRARPHELRLEAEARRRRELRGFEVVFDIGPEGQR
jgi:hypothetical protein